MKKMIVLFGILTTMFIGTQSFASCPCSNSYTYRAMSPCPCQKIVAPCCPVATPCPCPVAMPCPACPIQNSCCNSCNSCNSCNDCCDSCNSCNNNCCREKCSWWKFWQNKNCCTKCNDCCN